MRCSDTNLRFCGILIVSNESKKMIVSHQQTSTVLCIIIFNLFVIFCFCVSSDCFDDCALFVCSRVISLSLPFSLLSYYHFNCFFHPSLYLPVFFSSLSLYHTVFFASLTPSHPLYNFRFSLPPLSLLFSLSFSFCLFLSLDVIGMNELNSQRTESLRPAQVEDDFEEEDESDSRALL